MIAVSFLKSKLSRIETLKKIDESDADLIHVDLIDGIYVGERNFEISKVLDELKNVDKPLDIHLMVENPEQYIAELAKLKPNIITFHLNTTDNIESTIDLIKDYNIKVGIAINPDESIYLIDELIDKIDYILIMGVYPGMGGQSFIPEVLNKVDYLANKDILLGIDGGVNDESIKMINKHKFDVIVSGSFVCMSDDYNDQISKLKA